MHISLIISLKLFVMMLVVYYLTSTSSQTISHTANQICLNITSANRLCVQCYHRSKQVADDRGYIVEASRGASVIKMVPEDNYITCEQSLQLLNFEKDSDSGTSFHLQQILPISQILALVQGKFLYNPTGSYTIEPAYNQFMVYGWQSKQFVNSISVTTINPEFLQQVENSLFYLLNFVVLLAIIWWMADSSAFEKVEVLVKISIFVIFGCLELAAWGIWPYLFHLIARVFILNLGLMNFKFKTAKITALIVLGLILSAIPLTLCLYTAVILYCLFVADSGNAELQALVHLKYHLIFFTSILFLNYLYWFNYVLYGNDVICRLIEFCCLIYILVGIFVVEKKTDGRTKIGERDPDTQRIIRLAGFEEEDDGTL